MWYKELGFKVDRNLLKAMKANGLEEIKKILAPSESPAEVSLNSLLPEVIKLGRIDFEQKEALLEFYRLDEQEKEEGKVIFNNYLIESIDILIELIDYLVSKGADVNAVMNPEEHNICCSDSKAQGAGSFGNATNHYNLSASIFMPLAIGKFNASILGKIESACKWRIKGESSESRQIKFVQKKLYKYIVEQNYNMQVKLTKKLIDKGASLDTSCVSKQGHKIKFLDFIEKCGDDSYTKQKAMFLVLYNLLKQTSGKEIIKTFKFIKETFRHEDKGEAEYPIEHTYRLCSALKELIEQKKIEKLSPEVGKKLAFDITSNSHNPIGYVANFLTITECAKVLNLTKEKDLSGECSKMEIECSDQMEI